MCPGVFLLLRERRISCLYFFKFLFFGTDIPIGIIQSNLLSAYILDILLSLVLMVILIFIQFLKFRKKNDQLYIYFFSSFTVGLSAGYLDLENNQYHPHFTEKNKTWHVESSAQGLLVTST